MLSANGITVRFGGVVAVDNVSFDVPDGTTLGLIGPNGSGKSTFLNALTGVVPSTGTASLDGRRLPLGKPRSTRRAGLARTFQTPQNFGELSCIENVLLADSDRRFTGLTGAWLARPSMWRSERARWKRALDHLELVGLGAHAEQPASLLSYGQQRMLELARSLVGTPSILLLDEPSAGLNATETAELGRILLDVRDRGLALLIVDHKIDFIDSLCDTIVVLQLGRVVASGAPSEVWKDPVVVEAYLGEG
ncbi:MAG: ABC transporter ATP-binding protein [Ilumatobacteraceae bacterium]